MTEHKPDTLWHQSGVNPEGEPFVQLIKGKEVLAQMTTAQARDHAQAMLDAAEAAETDAFVYTWVIEHVGAGPEQAAGLLTDFRRWRAAHAGKREGPRHDQDWVLPPKQPQG